MSTDLHTQTRGLPPIKAPSLLTTAAAERLRSALATWDWPHIEVCRATPKPTTPYTDLYGNCVANETLPSLAFGMKSCSIKWKQVPLELRKPQTTRG